MNIVQDFYNKNIGDTAISEIKEKEIKGREEFLKQDDFLKHRISSLKDELNASGKKNEFYYSTMEENTKLMNEINMLRKEANFYLNKYTNFKYLSTMKRVDELKKKKKKIENST